MSAHGDHERRDIPARVPVYVILFTAVFVPLGALAMWLLMVTVWQAAPAPEPIFDEPAQREVTAPQLQRAPPADMAGMTEEQGERLNRAGWVDREAGVVRMPIDRAMDLLVERGLPEASDRRPAPAREPASDAGEGTR